VVSCVKRQAGTSTYSIVPFKAAKVMVGRRVAHSSWVSLRGRHERFRFSTVKTQIPKFQVTC
jgi:hypothetical protein